MGFEQLQAMAREARAATPPSQDWQVTGDCPNDGTRLEVDGNGRRVCPFDGWRPPSG